MAVIVQITSGPLSGRKTYLRAGQVLRVGRTEWADFAVPHDAELADVHFALSFDSAYCRVRDLDTPGGTLLNGKKITEAVVEHGDKITAGKTQFVIKIEGAAEGGLGAITPVGAGLAAGKSTAAALTSGFVKVEIALSTEVCKLFQLDDAAKPMLQPEQRCRAFFDLLVATEIHADAARFLAHALPKREAAWWACRAVRLGEESTLGAKDSVAITAAEQWVTDPTEPHRRQCMAAAEGTGFETAAGWAAAAAAWSGGSMAPPEFPPVPPGETLTAQAAVTALKLAALAWGPPKIKELEKKQLAVGVEIADGKDVWPEKSSHLAPPR